MKSARTILPLFVVSVVFLAGCDHHRRYRDAGPPPPAYDRGSPLERAEQEGFRVGVADGQRDLGRGHYQPKKNPGYRNTPGYDAHVSRHDYQSAYRRGYIRGYDQSYRRR